MFTHIVDGLSATRCPEPSLTAIIRDHLHVHLLQYGGNCALAVSGSPPPSHSGHFTSQFGGGRRQTDGYDVLLVDHIPVQADQSHVIYKVCRIVMGMHFLSLDAILFVV